MGARGRTLVRPVNADRGRRSRLSVVIGAVAALLVGLGGGTAYAYLTSQGGGSGTARVGSTQSVTVLQATGTVTNELSPGSSGDLLLRLDNPNPSAVTITSLSGNGTVVASGGIGPCVITGVSVPTQSGLRIDVPPGNTVSVTVPKGVSMGQVSDNGCQGATVHVPVSITVHEG